VAVGVMQALTPADNVLSTYREHGHALARGMDPGAIMAEMYGKQEGCSGGRGGSMHLFDKRTRFYGGNAIVAGHLPLAVGLALADKKQKREAITVCFFGEGAAAEGVFHESMNLAALWKVPALFICENNQYAMGTALRYSHGSTDLVRKGEAYGIPSKHVDGMDLRAVMKATDEAVMSIRSGNGPELLVCETYRFRAHSMFDAELYREKSEVEEWKKRDPIIQYEQYLALGEQDIKAMDLEVASEVQRAIEFAEAGTWEAVDSLLRHVTTEPTTAP
jgi:pyruvate dehydrogenase E1 component alpha subunit/2-oxoisovalerate dehydrogenase E1 component